jgi:NAD(P)H-flavin reductase
MTTVSAMTTASATTGHPATTAGKAMTTTMTPTAYRVVERREETADTVTLSLAPTGTALPAWQPGQFTMVYGFGVGEVPVSISGGSGTLIRHTIRAVGATTRALCGSPVGAVLGLRGPFGHGWPPVPEGVDAVIVAGGIGLAPLRPVILAALGRPGRTFVLIGARTPEDLVYAEEYDRWRAAGAEVLTTVDRASLGWPGQVGVVTTRMRELDVAPGAVGYVCGPEIMMRFAAQGLIEHGIRLDDIAVSLERNMHCGAALCGHCQLGPVLLCRDGPVTTARAAATLLASKER